MKKNKGMTLLELLVVMVLLSFVTVLMVQGVGFALKSYEVSQRNQGEHLSVTLVDEWLRISMAGVQAELDEAFYFKGDSKSITAYTQRALVSLPGQSKKISWFVKAEGGRYSLFYQQESDGLNWKVMDLDGYDSVSFSFVDINGNSQQNWPGEIRGDNIPKGIFLVLSCKENTEKRFFLINKKPTPRPDFRDI